MTSTPFSWLPNAISCARMLLAAPLAWLILADNHGGALGLALAGGVSDGLDGWLAKRFGWQSQLGGVLDPVADKLMLVAAFTALTIVGEIPWWLFGVVLVRDMVIVAGAVVYHNLVGPLNAKPTPISKLTTLLQIIFVVALLVHQMPQLDLPAALLAMLLWLVAATTVASGVHYVVTWSLRTRNELAARRKPA